VPEPPSPNVTLPADNVAADANAKYFLYFDSLNLLLIIACIEFIAIIMLIMKFDKLYEVK